jgi:hypothetical protein
MEQAFDHFMLSQFKDEIDKAVRDVLFLIHPSFITTIFLEVVMC